jgi:hypothetical protein
MEMTVGTLPATRPAFFPRDNRRLAVRARVIAFALRQCRLLVLAVVPVTLVVVVPAARARSCGGPSIACG